MFWIVFGIYTLFTVLVFGFFIVAKTHFFQFREYNTHIEPVTKILATILVFLALIGYYFLFSWDAGSIRTQTVGEATNTEIY